MRPIERRIGLLFAGFLVLLLFAAGRAVWFGTLGSARLERAALTQQVSELPVPAQRGTIRDRHGIELAVSEPALAVAANPFLIGDPVRLADRLAGPLRTDARVLLRKLADRDAGFVYLARGVPAARVEPLRRLKLTGIELLPETRRVYPRGWLAAQLLGTVGTDNVGRAGLEYAQQRVLRGHDGTRRLVKDALGEPISLRDLSVARPGSDVTLTIDARIQDRVEAVLGEVGRVWRPKGATAIALDPRSGEVLALANWPRVDPATFGSAPEYARQNRAVGAVYEPGSTFKAITMAGALEEQVTRPQTTFDLAPQIEVADRTIKEAHERGWVRLSAAEILAQSSNVGAITIATRMGEQRFATWVERFGFGHSTGSGIPGEERGIVPSVDRYSGASIGNLPIGQGLSVTPMQMAVAYAAIANGGILRAPRLLRAVGERRRAPPRGRRVVSAATASDLRLMLEGVTGPGGTAPEAAIEGYALAGKTGTAQKPDPLYGGYSKTRYVASFVGFAPVRAPRLLVAVMVDEPQGAITGGQVAAPAFQRIMSFALPYLQVAPE